jgi:hypothetical protein
MFKQQTTAPQFIETIKQLKGEFNAGRKSYLQVQQEVVAAVEVYSGKKGFLDVKIRDLLQQLIDVKFEVKKGLTTTEFDLKAVINGRIPNELKDQIEPQVSEVEKCVFETFAQKMFAEGENHFYLQPQQALRMASDLYPVPGSDAPTAPPVVLGQPGVSGTTANMVKELEEGHRACAEVLHSQIDGTTQRTEQRKMIGTMKRVFEEERQVLSGTLKTVKNMEETVVIKETQEDAKLMSDGRRRETTISSSHADVLASTTQESEVIIADATATKEQLAAAKAKEDEARAESQATTRRLQP